MGNAIFQANANPDENIYDLNTLNNRIYALAPAYSVYRLNVTEDDWETPLVVPLLPDDNIRSISFDGKLYIYPLNNTSSQLLRVNDTEDAIIPVCDYPSRGYFRTMGVVNGSLYASCIDSFSSSSVLMRLNAGAWESLATYTDDYLAHSIVEFNGRLYNFSSSGVVYRLSIDGLSYDPVVYAPTINSYGTAIVFNGRLYFTTSYQLYRLSEDETSIEWVADESSSININKTFIYNNRLYMVSCKILRLNETEDGLEDLWGVDLFPSPCNITSTVVNNNKVYFHWEAFMGALYRYSSIFSAFTGSPLVGIPPQEIDFTSTVVSDFPITGYLWDFGDLGTSTDTNPTHEYTTGGLFDVSLEASNSLDTDTAISYGYITIIDPTVHYIHNVGELQLIGSGAPGYPAAGRYALANDIDASGTETWNGGLGFEPIAYFIGELDGAGHIVSNLHINRPGEPVGIFNTCGSVSIKNLSVVSAVMVGTYVGLITCYGTGLVIFENCHVSGTINSDGLNTCGSLLAIAYEGCEATLCTATLTADNCTAGGLVGSVYSHGMFLNCSTDVTYTQATGGFGGFASFVESSSFENCSSVIDAEVTTGAGNCAGFIGYASSVQALNCTSSGSIRFSYGTSAGTAGGFSAWLSGSAQNCTSNVNISSEGNYFSYTGGFTGYAYGNLTDCTSTGNLNLKCIGNSNYIGGFAAIGGLAISITRCNSSGDVTLEVIDSTGIAYASSFISYLQSNLIGTCYSTGNLTITGKGSFIGGFCGYGSLPVPVSNCFASGDVIVQGSSESTAVGGFAGSLYGDFSRCFSLGSVVGSDVSGGFAGFLSGTLSECFSKGNLTGIGTDSRSILGGLIGDLQGSIIDCYATGNVLNTIENDNRVLGGLIGNASESSTIVRCYSIGNVSESALPYVFPAKMGGLIGYKDIIKVAEDSYWDIETSGQLISDGGEGKTTEEMQHQSTYTNWNFTDVWKIRE